jgi:mannose-6-phosphate isomerase class I
LPLLLKYIFTSERLSIQVHPNDEQARASGLPHGKNECWYILDAEPDAVLGLGLKTPMTPAALRASILDGSIEQLIDWRPAQAATSSTCLPARSTRSARAFTDRSAAEYRRHLSGFTIMAARATCTWMMA